MTQNEDPWSAAARAEAERETAEFKKLLQHYGFLWIPDQGKESEIQHWYRADEADARIAELECGSNQVVCSKVE